MGCCGNTKGGSNSCATVNESTVPEVTPCSGHTENSHSKNNSSCCPPKQSFDFLLWGSTSFVVLAFVMFFLPINLPSDLHIMAHTSVEMLAAMWWGVLLAIFFVGLLGRIPKELVMALLGRAGSKTGLLRATGAGLFFDLCSHGILLVGMKLYERGASLGQVMAFLIASPWNSFSLTLILFGLIGVPLTLTFIVASAIIALISGRLFDIFVARQVLPDNPSTVVETKTLNTQAEFKLWWQQSQWQWRDWLALIKDGLSGSKMVLRWLLFGIVLVAIVRVFVTPDNFATWFGASFSGLLLTLLATTLIEVCSEGSTPIASDLVNRANAPGNGFTFLMAGVATDYTEIMSIKDTTQSWKIALFLPLLTVPQVLLIGWLLNQ